MDGACSMYGGEESRIQGFGGENGELLIMPANSRWDLIRGLKG